MFRLAASNTRPGSKEAIQMESILFFLVIFAAIAGLYWLKHRSHGAPSRSAPPSSHHASQAGNTTQLSTPGNNLLASNNKVWNTRRKHAANMAVKGDQFKSNVRFEEEPEYDGYSRRDRHHLAPAHIKDEQHADELAMTHIEFKSSKTQEATKS
jgi:hypothetical protein